MERYKRVGVDSAQRSVNKLPVGVVVVVTDGRIVTMTQPEGSVPDPRLVPTPVGTTEPLSTRPRDQVGLPLPWFHDRGG